jgi:DNA replication and repair protein RecF
LRLRELRVHGWRNLESVTLRPGDRATVLFGQNGQGKTNLLEAAYTALCFRSFRTSSLSEAIAWDGPGSTVEVDLSVRGIERTLRLEVGQGRKQTQIDGKSVRRDSSLIEGIGAVFFGPEDLWLPRAAASERRRFLDRAVFGAYRPYFREAQAFEKLLKSRNLLLRRGSCDSTLLASYDERLAQAGARIVVRRRSLVSALRPIVLRTFEHMHSGVAVDIQYRSDPRLEAEEEESRIELAMREGLMAHRASDLKQGFTGFGPHRDDLELQMAGHLAREHASQGQLRSLVLALKVAELENLQHELNEQPLLLLDDVASELDEERRGKLFEVMATLDCQTMMTVTEREHLPPLEGCIDCEVSNGRLRIV